MTVHSKKNDGDLRSTTVLGLETGTIEDKFSPQAPFFGAAIVALMGVVGFIYIGRSWKRQADKLVPEASAASDGPLEL